ncbi:ROK family protein [Corynebacterium freiburgense]|uniref:ROK family protein n=1 Tax=Corynebacterium freiburgense TaxID=556548 RepID=UPI000400DE0C|nr:ROK family protein [Corynebacterium freiburgense]WJZ02970.1 Beta-glucoside kinase [Corynebacterium freiburgense]
MSTCVIAVDIGGTKIATGFIDPTYPTEVLGRESRPTRAQEGGNVVLAEVLAAVAETIAAATTKGYQAVAIGIGAPGVVNPNTGTIVSAGPTMPHWAGVAVAEAVAQETGLPVAMHNDVRIMGLGEAVYGAGRKYQEVLFISIGTGIGGAIISDGVLRPSPHNSRGEVAYIYAPTPAGGCDTIENIGAGPSLARTYQQQSRDADANIDLREIMKRYHTGDVLARQVISQGMACVGQGLAGFINALDVEAVVIGGGVGTIGPEITNPLTQALRQNLLPALAEIPVNPAELGTNAPLVGAAYFAMKNLKEDHGS